MHPWKTTKRVQGMWRGEGYASMGEYKASARNVAGNVKKNFPHITKMSRYNADAVELFTEWAYATCPGYGYRKHPLPACTQLGRSMDCT